MGWTAECPLYMYSCSHAKHGVHALVENKVYVWIYINNSLALDLFFCAYIYMTLPSLGQDIYLLTTGQFQHIQFINLAHTPDLANRRTSIKMT